MSWTNKRFHLIFIALVLWGDTNGFSVWNATFIADWETGHSNASWNQNVKFATPVHPFELLSRKGANGNVEEGKSSSFVLTSEAQAAQHDSNFVQSSGASVRGKRVPSTPWPIKGHYKPGFQNPSFLQSAATSNQASGSWTSLSFLPNTAEVLANNQDLTSSTSLTSLDQSTSSSSQSFTTNQITESQTQTTYLPDTTSVQTSGWYTILQGRLIPSSFQVSGFPSPSLSQPSTTTRVMTDQSHPTSPAPTLTVSTLHQGPASTSNLTLQDQSIPSSSQSVNTNQVTTYQAQPTNQPSTTTPVSTGWSAIAQTQSLGGLALYPGQNSAWYTILQGRLTPSSFQVSGFQSQSLIQPTSPAPTLTASTLHQGPASTSNLTLQDQSIPSSSPSVNTNQINTAWAQPTNQPSTTTPVLTGQSAIAQTRPLGGLAIYPGQNSGWYTILQGQLDPSSYKVSGFLSQLLYQHSTTKQVMAAQSHSTSSALTLTASTLHQGLVSSNNLTLQNQSIPSSSQSVNTNQINTDWALPTTQPSTTKPALTGQSAIAQTQSLGGLALYPGQNSTWYTILQGRLIPSSFQVSGFQSQSLIQATSPTPTLAPSTSNQGLASSSNVTQSSYQPSTTTQVLAGQSAIAPAQSIEASYPGRTSVWYTILQGQRIPSTPQGCGFQNQSAYQPSSTTWGSASQSASTAPVQSSGASTLYHSLGPSSSLTLQNTSIPPSSQSVVIKNQIVGSQTQSSYQPNTTTQVFAGQSASLIPSMGASTLYQGHASSGYNISQEQSILSSSQSVTINPISGFQSQTSYWPNTKQIGLQKQFTPQAQGSSINAKWYKIFPGQAISPFSRFSGFQTQSSHQSSLIQILTDQSASGSASRSSDHGSSGAESSVHTKWYNKLQGQNIPSSSQISDLPTQSSYRPSFPKKGQFPSLPQTESSASTLYQGLKFGSLTSRGLCVPFSFQSMGTTN